MKSPQNFSCAFMRWSIGGCCFLRCMSPEVADFVARVGLLLMGRRPSRLGAAGFDPPALTPFTQLQRYAMYRARAGGGRATSVASRLGFCAIAARTNSSWAPRGRRSRRRPSFRMRFRWANRISIFLRSRRDFSKLFGADERSGNVSACSWMSRGILRDGSFGQHWGLSGHTSQSSLPRYSTSPASTSDGERYPCDPIWRARHDHRRCRSLSPHPGS